MADKDFDGDAFFQALERTVRTRGTTWKSVSQDTGVSQTTLTRMGQGRRPDAASMAALSAWADINPAHYVSGTYASKGGLSSANTLEQISLLLRQDKQLSDDAKQKLYSIVESAYNALKSDS